MSGDLGVVAAIVQARMTSTRLSGKVMKPLAGVPLIVRTVERVARIAGVDRVVVALAEGGEHDPVAAALEGHDVSMVRGPEDDVLARTAAAARAVSVDTVMRITSDCPLVDPGVSAAVLQAYAAGRASGLRYARTAFDAGFPLGFDTEVLAAATLYEAEARAVDPYEREHVTPYVWRNPDRYPAIMLSSRPDRRHWRLVVDTLDDYRLACAIYDRLYPANPAFSYSDLCTLFEAQPELLTINRHVEQKPYVGLA